MRIPAFFAAIAFTVIAGIGMPSLAQAITVEMTTKARISPSTAATPAGQEFLSLTGVTPDSVGFFDLVVTFDVPTTATPGPGIYRSAISNVSYAGLGGITVSPRLPASFIELQPGPSGAAGNNDFLTVFLNSSLQNGAALSLGFDIRLPLGAIGSVFDENDVATWSALYSGAGFLGNGAALLYDNSGGASIARLNLLAGPNAASFRVIPNNTNVPEPASIAVLAIGLAGIGIAGRRKRSV
jgi:hypothetical protein